MPLPLPSSTTSGFSVRRIRRSLPPSLRLGTGRRRRFAVASAAVPRRARAFFALESAQPLIGHVVSGSPLSASKLSAARCNCSPSAMSESAKSSFCDNFRQKCTTSRIVLKKTIMKSIDDRRKFDTLLEIFLAEIIGTGLLMYFGCMGSFGSLTMYQQPPPMQGGLMFGFVVSSLISGLGHISKAHLNPAVTLCAYLLGTINASAAAVYVVAEIIGAVVGFYFLQVTCPDTFWEHVRHAPAGFCTTTLHDSVSVQQGFLIEFAATSFLIFTVCSVWDPRNASTSDSVAIKFALLISALSICAGPFTGASLNPARTLAPAIVNNNWNNHWLYWLAPLSGSAITTSLYKYVFMRSLRTSTSDESNAQNLLDSLKERKALNDDSSEEKSLNIA